MGADGGEAAASSAQSPYTTTLPGALTETDLATLDKTDAQHTLHTWPNLQTIIKNNDLHLLTRSPSQLRAYLAWTAETKAAYGTITDFLLQQRLHWTPLPSTDPGAAPAFAYRNEIPFVDPEDYLVLRNDWPYGLDPGIVHMVVWLKTPLALKPEDGDLTSDSRALVEEFVEKRFRKTVGEGTKGERVLWFKNWTRLQSVRGIDHVHVLIKDADDELVERLVKG